MELSAVIVNFFKKQKFVVVSTINKSGYIHCSAKGIVGIEKDGKVYLIDAYRASTLENLKNNPKITLTSVDGQDFIGYSLKGTAKIVEREKIKEHIIAEWEQRIIKRISDRLIKNVQAQNPGLHHPEAMIPPPQYLIEVDVEAVIDLAPHNLKSSIILQTENGNANSD
ncbi:MAG: pyridoxamine 5'-phosphate oxidase family protein [Candidatus Omnitrophota bacterium]